MEKFTLSEKLHAVIYKLDNLLLALQHKHQQ